MQLFQVFNDQGTRPFTVKRKNHGAVAAQGHTKLAGGVQGKKAAIQEFATETAHDRAVGRDHHRVFIEPPRGDKWHGVSLPAAGGNDNFNTGGFGRTQSRTVAMADAEAGRGQKSAVDIDSY